jgi:hypothetical protein
MRRCFAITRKLKRCKNTVNHGSIFCEAHQGWWIITLFGGIVALTTFGANIATIFEVFFPTPTYVPATSIPAPILLPPELLTPTFTQSPINFTITPTITLTSTLIPTATWTPIPTLDIADQLVGQLDIYFSCLNSAVPNDGDNSDYEVCWNLLSNRPGEYQSINSKKNFIDYWKKYKISYALFFCPKEYNNSKQYFVHVRYYRYDRKDDSTPIENGTQNYAEYIFAHDEQGWRIKGVNLNLDDIGSYCENDPRINKLDTSP